MQIGANQPINCFYVEQFINQQNQMLDHTGNSIYMYLFIKNGD